MSNQLTAINAKFVIAKLMPFKKLD